MKGERRYHNHNTPFKGVTYNGEFYEHGTMSNRHIKEALGCDPKRHWPAEGVPPTRVRGILVKVLPAFPGKHRSGSGGRRCLALHEPCGRWVCTGHFGQHLEGCKH